MNEEILGVGNGTSNDEKNEEYISPNHWLEGNVVSKAGPKN